MARQVRIEYDGAFYHVTSRGNQREKIYFYERDRERFLDILRRTKERYGYLLHAYALMDNHYHMLLETPKANLSQIMQNINTSYTVYINRRYGRSGHLFQGRYKGIIVDKDEYLVALSRYIHLNPVRAGLVQRPREARWTSYGAYVGRDCSEGLVDTADTLATFSERKKEAIRKYRTFVEDGIGTEEKPLEEAEAGLILGKGKFKDKVMRLLENLSGSDELPQLKRLETNRSLEAVVTACGIHLDMPKDALIRRRRAFPERKIAIYLSKVLSGKSNVTIGEYFGIKGMAVSRVLTEMEHRSRRDKALRRQIEKVKEKVLSVK